MWFLFSSLIVKKVVIVKKKKNFPSKREFDFNNFLFDVNINV